MQSDYYKGLIVFFGTKDLKATHRYYTGVLGLKMYKDQGTCQIFVVPGGGKIGFCTHLDVIKEKNEPIITLVTDDVELAYVDLTASGLKADGLPQINPKFNINSFYAKDPNGYIVEVQQFLDEHSMDGISRDETSMDETSRDGISKDETCRDGISRDETSMDETCKDV